MLRPDEHGGKSAREAGLLGGLHHRATGREYAAVIGELILDIVPIIPAVARADYFSSYKLNLHSHERPSCRAIPTRTIVPLSCRKWWLFACRRCVFVSRHRVGPVPGHPAGTVHAIPTSEGDTTGNRQGKAGPSGEQTPWGCRPATEKSRQRLALRPLPGRLRAAVERTGGPAPAPPALIGGTGSYRGRAPLLATVSSGCRDGAAR